jgi:hypothetical protein
MRSQQCPWQGRFPLGEGLAVNGIQLLFIGMAVVGRLDFAVTLGAFSNHAVDSIVDLDLGCA